MRIRAPFSREPLSNNLPLEREDEAQRLLPPKDSHFILKPRFLAVASRVLCAVAPADLPFATPFITEFMSALLASLLILECDWCNPVSEHLCLLFLLLGFVCKPYSFKYFIQVSVQMSHQRPPYLKDYRSSSPHHLSLYTCIYLVSWHFLPSDIHCV